ncbi:hypothetical protein HNR53_000966 [Bacillus benzoevorans]|uniref:Uncharacterized protein n=1 Tax=Bacillus benzoevorans TaxID=1456 RepID=A0A7X0LUB6_9BACI|nr:hypothetical protein [Bacillus benzoevorans]
MACGCNKRRVVKKPITKQSNQQNPNVTQTKQQKPNEK